MSIEPYQYQPAAGLLKDRAILVTGASDGIGRQAALSFAAHGATVALLARNETNLEQVYDQITATGGPEPLLIPFDLGAAAPGQFEQLAELLEQDLGRLDGLLHNAALLGALSPIEHFDPETWYKVFQVNTHAPFLLTQACLPLLKQAPDASVVFTSDRVGRQGRAYWGAYGASKFAAEGLMQTLADEVEANTAVRVNSIDPGPIRTRLRNLAYPGEDVNSVPTADTIMPAYLYLMGEDSRSIHGQALDAYPPS
jgi:NAD(P)-dependent dehydrogenase (short-subunit alcohol dehydrogenase family)